MHAFHRGARPCGRRQLLRHVRRAQDLRPVHAGRARSRDPSLRAHLLLLGVRRHGLDPHVPAPQGAARHAERDRGSQAPPGRPRPSDRVHAARGRARSDRRRAGRGDGVRYYPVFLDLDGQHAVVLGGGTFATEKVALLLEAGARVKVVSAKLSKSLQGLVTNGAIEVVARDYEPGDLAGARLAVDASENEEINRRSWVEAESTGVLTNVVDRPAQCRFIAPAIVRRDPVVIAISTAGESPFLASALRARLERSLGREWGPFTALVGRIRRELRARGVSIAEQTKVYRRLLTSDIRDLIQAGRHDDAEHRAAALAQTTVRQPRRVALVGAGPGDPELLTLKARELIGDADHVL